MRDSSPSEQALAARAVNPDRFADDDDDAPSKGRQALGSRLSDAARRRAGAAKRHVEAVAQSPVGAAALGAVVAYVAVRGTLEVCCACRQRGREKWL